MQVKHKHFTFCLMRVIKYWDINVLYLQCLSSCSFPELFQILSHPISRVVLSQMSCHIPWDLHFQVFLERWGGRSCTIVWLKHRRLIGAEVTVAWNMLPASHICPLAAVRLSYWCQCYAQHKDSILWHFYMFNLWIIMDEMHIFHCIIWWITHMDRKP